MKYSNYQKDMEKLNTKGCCFLCLKTEEIQSKGNEVAFETSKSVFIGQLLRHLRISEYFATNRKSERYQADMCALCKDILRRFSSLFQEMEKVQIELNYCLGSIHKCISESKEDSVRVQNYSKRMTSDPEALAQLAFVDNLRKEIASRSMARQVGPILKVELERTEKLKEKLDIKEEIADSDHYFEPMDYVAVAFEETKPDMSTLPIDPIQSSSNSGNDDLQPEVKFDPAQIQKQKRDLTHKKKKNLQKSAKANAYYRKSNGKFHCRKCDKSSWSSFCITQHYESVHLNIRYKCDICKGLFTSQPNLKIHKRTCRERIEKRLAKERDPKFKFICKICKKKFDTEHKLSSHHYNLHRYEGRFKCNFCNKKFSSASGLRKHKDCVHLKIRFECKFCSKKYSSKDKFARHQKNCTTPQKRIEIGATLEHVAKLMSNIRREKNE